MPKADQPRTDTPFFSATRSAILGPPVQSVTWSQHTPPQLPATRLSASK